VTSNKKEMPLSKEVTKKAMMSDLFIVDYALTLLVRDQADSGITLPLEFRQVRAVADPGQNPRGG
jgi:hypothetical protein